MLGKRSLRGADTTAPNGDYARAGDHLHALLGYPEGIVDIEGFPLAGARYRHGCRCPSSEVYS